VLRDDLVPGETISCKTGVYTVAYIEIIELWPEEACIDIEMQY
jgi:hypothetical protein